MDTDEGATGSTPSRFAYEPPVLRVGRGTVDELERELAAHGIERALVVSGRTVGTTEAVIEPVRTGLGDRLVGVFAETTPEKRLDTALAAGDRIAELEADGVISLGGGSSLDVATAATVVAGSGRPHAELAAEFERAGTLQVPDEVPPIVAVPTTLAGAELSHVAGLTATPENGLVDEPVSGGLSHPRLTPAAVVADPALYETTPWDVLRGSAMNGFDKGLETPYARTATPVTDATAARGLRLLRAGLLGLGADPDDSEAIELAVEGSVLVQYGITRPDGTTVSLVHAFGHALRDHTGLQQGVAHAIVVPHALRYLFERVDGRRELLADALGVESGGDDPDERGESVVHAVVEVRDALGLPDRLRTVDGLDRSDLPAVAESTLSDAFVANVPEGLDPTAEDLVRVLEAAW